MSRSTSKKVKPSSEGGTDAAEQELLELYGELSITQRNLRKAFKDEVRLLIHFELLLIVSIVQIMNEEKQHLIQFITHHRDQLEQKGLGFFVLGPQKLSLDARYKLIMDRYEGLDEQQKQDFDDLKDKFMESIKNQQQEEIERAKKEAEAKRLREEELAEKL
mmetsp:Transcript_963/g.882  ORF Transcript_963/g.882 Transcript_963/m.882 type:complete len:162 (-) Transcript_963:1628-2113(-)